MCLYLSLYLPVRTRNSYLHLITDGIRSHTINYLVLVLTLSSGMWKRESERDREEGNTYFITNNKAYFYITMIMKWNGIIEQSNTTINQKKVGATTTSSTSHSSPPIRFYLIYISNNLWLKKETTRQSTTTNRSNYIPLCCVVLCCVVLCRMFMY